MQNLSENQRYCLDMVRRDDHERYLASLFVPKASQAAVWTLLAFNQEVAKIRENTSEGALAEIRLQWWQEVLEEIQAGSIRQQPVIRALASLNLPSDMWRLLGETLDARRVEMASSETADQESLKNYAYGTGGALHEAIGRICNKAPVADAANDVARSVGAAWAMMGLIRALPFHWQANQKLPLQENDAALQTRDASRAFEILKPTIQNMRYFVEVQVLAATKGSKNLSEKPNAGVFALPLIKIHLKTLKKAGGNPFEMPAVEPSDLRKILGLMWHRLARRS